MEAVKTCKDCGEIKPVEEFQLRSDSGKRRNECRSCKSSREQVYREKNFSKLQISKKEYYTKNADSIREKGRLYRKANKEAIRERNKKRYRNNPLKMKEQMLKHHYSITLSEFNTLLQQQENRCPVCRDLFSEDNKPCVDHNYTTRNVRGLLCGPCNTVLGLIREDLKRLEGAQTYLVSPPARLLGIGQHGKCRNRVR